MPSRCTAATKSGPCRAWAVRGTDPPLCSAHAGRNTGAGAPEGNQNARTAGFYSGAISDEELADLAVLGDDNSLTDEIAAVRVVIRRVLAALEAAVDPPLAACVFDGARTVAKLLRDRKAISGEAADNLLTAIDQAIQEFITEAGINP